MVHLSRKSFIELPFLFQKSKLITNIEKLAFWVGENEALHFAKQELMMQIDNLDISINGNDFFTIDRQFLAGVSRDRAAGDWTKTNLSIYSLQQIAAVCCTYIFISIQFYLQK